MGFLWGAPSVCHDGSFPHMSATPWPQSQGNTLVGISEQIRGSCGAPAGSCVGDPPVIIFSSETSRFPWSLNTLPAWKTNYLSAVLWGPIKKTECCWLLPLCLEWHSQSYCAASGQKSVSPSSESKPPVFLWESRVPAGGGQPLRARLSAEERIWGSTYFTNSFWPVLLILAPL